MSESLWTVELTRLLCPWDSPGKNWSGLPFPPAGDLLNPGIEPVSSVSPALQVDSLLLSHQGRPELWLHCGYFLPSLCLKNICVLFSFDSGVRLSGDRGSSRLQGSYFPAPPKCITVFHLGLLGCLWSSPVQLDLSHDATPGDALRIGCDVFICLTSEWIHIASSFQGVVFSAVKRIL